MTAVFTDSPQFSTQHLKFAADSSQTADGLPTGQWHIISKGGTQLWVYRHQDGVVKLDAFVPRVQPSTAQIGPFSAALATM